MLQSFRDNLKGTVAIILVGLICIPFALFGIDSLFNTQARAKPAAEVNGVEITEDELARAIQMRKSQLMQQFGENLPPQFLSDERLREPVLESLVQRAVLLDAASNSGMAVADESINQIIVSTPDFQVDGQFDAGRYQALIRTAGFTNQSYKDMLKNEILVNQFASGFSQSNFYTGEEINSLAAISLQTRDFNYFTVDKAPYLEQVTVTDEELKSYYDDNQNQFLTPEQVEIEALELSADAIAETVTVDDVQIEELYEQEKSSFMPSTQRRAAHILLDASAEDYESILADIQGRLKDGEDFAVLAKEYSQDFGSKDSGGDVGVTTGDSFVPEFETALAELEVGAISEPVESEFGVHIIKLLDVTESAMPTLDEMRLELAQNIKQSKAEELFLEKLNDFKDLTYNVESLEPVAGQLDLELWQSEPFSRFSGKGLASNPQVIEAAFSQSLIESGFSSDPIEVNESSVVVIRVKKHTPEAVKPFEEVKDQITTVIKSEKADELLAQSLESVIERANEGASFDELAAEMSVEVKSIEQSKRQQPDVDNAIVQAVFALPEPSEDKPIYKSVGLVSGEGALVQLVKVNSGDLDTVTGEEKTALQASMSGLYGEMDLVNLSQHLVSQAEVVN